jgi:hypothetical protein
MFLGYDLPNLDKQMRSICSTSRTPCVALEVR